MVDIRLVDNDELVLLPEVLSGHVRQADVLCPLEDVRRRDGLVVAREEHAADRVLGGGHVVAGALL